MTQAPPKRRGRDGASLPRVRAVSRAVSILRAFTADRPYLALSEIVRATGLDAGTTRRILVTLRDEGLVFQDNASGHYCASTGLLELGRSVPRSLSLARLLEGHLMRLAEDSQTTIYLSVPVDAGALCLSRLNGGRAIEVRWWDEGEVRPFDRGAGPRILLAYLPDAERERHIADLSAADGSSGRDLRRDLETIERAGFIVKHDEIALGLSAMAVPLLDDGGALLGAVSSGGLTPRYIGAAQADLLTLMQRAADDMQRATRGLMISTDEINVAY